MAKNLKPFECELSNFSHFLPLNVHNSNPVSNTETESMKDDTLFHEEYKVRILGQFLIFIFAIPLNSLVIYSFLGGGAQPTRVNYLVGHLCAINLVYTLFSVPFDVIWHITGKGVF